MQLFIDSADIEEIRQAGRWQVLTGATTNPSLIAKSGRNLEEVVAEIAAIISGPISAEVAEDTAEKMVLEGIKLAKINPKIIIKLPMTEDGIIACRRLVELRIRVNVTLIFTPSQALLAAANGATYISPFLGRVDDRFGEGEGIKSLERILAAVKGSSTKVIAASIRNCRHVEEAAALGCDIATIPFKVLKAMFTHELTEKGLAIFRQDAEKNKN